MTLEKKATFNEVAELYDQARNRYPEELFDELFRLTGCSSASHVLEIGAGTGIATLPLAERGCRITAIELGADMARVARNKLVSFDRVDIQAAAFEEWEPPAGAQYDLVLAATAFHWLDPAVRFSKTYSLLRPGGHLAIIRYHHVAGGDQDFFERVQDCYERYKPRATDKFRLPDIAELQPDTADLEASGLFEKPVIRSYVTEETYSREPYIDLLSTYSDHRIMPEHDREQLFQCIRLLIDGEFGGQVRKRYLNELILARKR